MAIPVRELTTKLTFDVDPRGVKKVESSISILKRSIKGMAGPLAAIGVALAGSKIAQIGLSLDQARSKFIQLGGTLTKSGKIAGELGRQLEDLDKLFKGREPFTRLDIFKAFVEFQNFAKDFPGIEDKFFEFFEFAALFKVAQGGDFGNIFSRLVGSLQTGSAELLAELPGVSDLMRGQIEEIVRITAGAFRFPAQQRPLITRLLLDVIREQLPELKRAAALIAETPAAQADVLKNKFAEALGKISLAITDKLLPVIKILTDAMVSFSDLFEGKTPKWMIEFEAGFVRMFDSLNAIGEKITDIFTLSEPQWFRQMKQFLGLGEFSPLQMQEAIRGAELGEPPEAGERPPPLDLSDLLSSRVRAGVQIDNISINVSGPEPVATAQLVVEKLNEMISMTATQFRVLEGRA